MKIDPREVAERASELAVQRNLTDREASIDASGKPDMIRDMRRGRMPSGDRIQALAETLGTTADFLLGKTPSSAVPGVDGSVLDFARLPVDVPVYGTALGADLEIEEDGTIRRVERTIIELTEVIDHVKRMPGIAGDREAYSLTVVGSSMSPRYDDGEPIWLSPKRQAAIGDYVVVQLFDENGSGEVISALIKRLVGRSSEFYELEQFTPPLKFKVPITQVARMHRVLSPRDLAGNE